MANFQSQIALAQRLIKANGAVVTWKKVPRVANIAQPWKAAVGTPVQQSFPGIFVLFTSQGLNNAVIQLLKGTDVTDSAPDAIIAGGQIFTPEITDIVVAPDGSSLVIAKIDPISPGGTAIIYRLRFD